VFYKEYFGFIMKGEVPVLNCRPMEIYVWESGDTAPRISNFDADWR
jgi:hypothetical protein